MPSRSLTPELALDSARPPRPFPVPAPRPDSFAVEVLLTSLRLCAPE